MRKQVLFGSNSDFDPIVKNSNVVKSLTSKTITDSSKQQFDFYHAFSSQYDLIVHPLTYFVDEGSQSNAKEIRDLGMQAIYPTALSDEHEVPEPGREKDLASVQKLSAGSAGFSEISAPLLQDASVKKSEILPTKKILHIIPEVGRGRLPGSQHIRLVVVTQNKDETFSDAYQKNKKVFDPRDFGLDAQSTFDDTNCGRYVAAMTIQAIGLAKDNLPITKENLKASPAVSRALHFNLPADAQKGLEFAYVAPLSKNPTVGEIINYNKAKIECLKAEYEARIVQGRQFHGTSIFGGYHAASLLTSKVAGFFNQAFSADDKKAAVDELETRFKDAIDKHQIIKLDGLPKAALQGELGKCVKAMQEAQTTVYEKRMQNRTR